MQETLMIVFIGQRQGFFRPLVVNKVVVSHPFYQFTPSYVTR